MRCHKRDVMYNRINKQKHGKRKNLQQAREAMPNKRCHDNIIAHACEAGSAVMIRDRSGVGIPGRPESWAGDMIYITPSKYFSENF